MHERAPRRYADACTAIAFVAAALVVGRHISNRRLFWSDEIFSWMLVTDPSWHHMLAAWRAGADGGGIFFYLLARAWLHLWGASELSFRLFSAAGTGLAAAFTFLLLRRFVRWQIAAPVVALLWFSSDVVLWQMIQARFYGMLLAGVAAAMLLFAIGSAQQRPSPPILILTFLAHMLLVGTHPFGAINSAAIIAAMLLVAARQRRTPSLALAAAAGWWILLPSLSALRSSAAIGRPHFWTTTPTTAELLATYTCWSLPVAFALGVGLTAALALLTWQHPRLPFNRPRVAESGAVIVAGAFLMVIPAVVWFGSLGASSLFVDRYLVPVVIPVALLLAWVTRTLDALAVSHLSRALLGSAVLSLLVWTARIAWVQYPLRASLPGYDTTAALVQALPRGMPIVVEPVDLFDRLMLYRRASGLDFISVLDWDEVTRPDALRGEVSGFHEMENWRKLGYFSSSIVDAATVLQRRQPFVVVDVPTIHWFEHHIEHNPAYTTELLSPPVMPDSPQPRIWIVRPNPHLLPATP